MPDPIFDQHTDETPSSSETTAAFNATLQTSTADLEAHMQAIVAESTATIARLGEELQTMLAESEARIDALIAEAGSCKIEEPPRQYDIMSDLKLSVSSSSLSAGLEVVVTETRDLPAAPQQKPLLYTTDKDGSLQPVSLSFWGDLHRMRRAFDEAATAIKFESPKGP